MQGAGVLDMSTDRLKRESQVSTFHGAAYRERLAAALRDNELTTESGYVALRVENGI